MELRFDAMLYSNLGNENFDAGYIKCSCGPHWAAGTHPCCKQYYAKYIPTKHATTKSYVLYML